MTASPLRGTYTHSRIPPPFRCIGRRDGGGFTLALTIAVVDRLSVGRRLRVRAMLVAAEALRKKHPGPLEEDRWLARKLRKGALRLLLSEGGADWLEDLRDGYVGPALAKALLCHGMPLTGLAPKQREADEEGAYDVWQNLTGTGSITTLPSV